MPHHWCVHTHQSSRCKRQLDRSRHQLEYWTSPGRSCRMLLQFDSSDPCGIRRCCHGCKRDSWKQSPASPGSSWGEAWLPTSSSPSYGSAARRQKVFGGAWEAKTHTSVDTDERKKNLFREPVERDICKEERRRGSSASKQTSVKLDCKPDLGTRGPTSTGLGFEGLLPASSCFCRDAHVVCCWCCHLQLLMLPSSIVMMLPIFNCCWFHLPLHKDIFFRSSTEPSSQFFPSVI
jgi:hypothetical protein